MGFRNFLSVYSNSAFLQVSIIFMGVLVAPILVDNACTGMHL